MPHWTVRRNVELVPWLIGIPNADALVSEAMGLVGFADGSFFRRYPRQLSGGHASASQWRGRSPPGPRCSSSTSRSAPSTPSHGRSLSNFHGA